MRKVIALAFVTALAVACGGDEPTVSQPEGSPQPEGPQEIAVTAVEYAFEGLPSAMRAGEVTVTFENGGDEDHEIQFARVIGDQSVEEILQLPRNQQMKEIEPLRGGIPPIAPGETETTTIDLDAGRYVAVCFIPTPEGTPHAFEGMIGEFTVE